MDFGFFRLFKILCVRVISCKIPFSLDGDLYCLWLVVQHHPCVVLERCTRLVELQDILPLYMTSLTSSNTIFARLSCPMEIGMVSAKGNEPRSNVARGGFLSVLRRRSGNMSKIHLDHRLRRISNTNLKHSIARNPHSGYVEMSFLSFRVVLEDDETRGCGACSHANGTRPPQAALGIRDLDYQGQ